MVAMELVGGRPNQAIAKEAPFAPVRLLSVLSSVRLSSVIAAVVVVVVVPVVFGPNLVFRRHNDSRSFSSTRV